MITGRSGRLDKLTTGLSAGKSSGRHEAVTMNVYNLAACPFQFPISLLQMYIQT
jgi:hypothetical protein